MTGSSDRANERRQLGTTLRAVVRVMTVSDSPDYDQPWQRQGPQTSTGSGAIVDTPRGLRVVTNAHCVEHAVFVDLRRYGKSRKFTGEIEALGHECDLAIIRVDDPSFYEGVTPLELGPLPHLSDKVKVCGYPVGGERLSITQGIVSRIDQVRYAQSQRRLLAVQIDAAINSGNSGGPVLKNGKLAGVAFQTLDDAASVGYIIPSPVIRHFLRDVEDGCYDGFPSLGIEVQPLEAPAHRRALGMRDDGVGVLVTRVAYDGSCWNLLRPGDVLLAIEGVPVGEGGTVVLRDGEIDFDYVLSRHQVGERAEVTIWRDGEEVVVPVTLKGPVYFVSEDGCLGRPSYFVFGGFLFVPLTRNYLRTWGDHWYQNAPHELVHLHDHGVPAEDWHEPVVLQKVLADTANVGYHDLESILIRTVQGIRVRSLRHLVALVDSTEDRYVRFGAHDGREFVLDRAQVLERGDRILGRFGVPADRSDDLRHAPTLVVSNAG